MSFIHCASMLWSLLSFADLDHSRLPRCDVLRASVSPRTITPISKAHSLEAVITYRVPERPEAQKLVITRSVDVYSYAISSGLTCVCPKIIAS